MLCVLVLYCTLFISLRKEATAAPETGHWRITVVNVSRSREPVQHLEYALDRENARASNQLKAVL